MYVCTPEHSLLVPSQLQDLYEVYIRELDEGNLDRAVALDKVTIGPPTRVPSEGRTGPGDQTIGSAYV